jgi:hypothetical protein
MILNPKVDVINPPTKKRDFRSSSTAMCLCIFDIYDTYS